MGRLNSFGRPNSLARRIDLELNMYAIYIHTDVDAVCGIAVKKQIITISLYF